MDWKLCYIRQGTITQFGTGSNVEILIIEADNDPLVEKTLREMLKATYPSANIINLQGAGPFPYLNLAAKYTKIVEEFFNGN